MVAYEPSSPTSASPGYANTPEKQDLDLKSLDMMLLEEHKKNINECLKEIQRNMNKLETHIMETQKSLKGIQENKAQEMEANKVETHTKKILKKCRRT